MHKHDVDTPALLLDLDVVEANITAMSDYFRARHSALRPHFKTPKTPEIARRQLAAGAIGITAAKLGEAEVLARAGLGPILIANQIVGAQKIDRLFALPANVEVIVAVESSFNVDQLEAGARRSGRVPQAIVEVDTGMHRCGTRTPEETVALVRRMLTGAVRYRGIMGYEGHAVLLRDPSERQRAAHAAMAELSRHVTALRDAGLAPEIVSAGGTGSYDIAAEAPDVTEVQAGSYVFMDGAYRAVRPDLGRPALTLLTTVVTVRDGLAILDCGLKSLTMEFGPPRGKDLPVEILRLSEEHAHLKLNGADLHAGEKIELVPSHGDTTLNLHDAYNVVRGDEVVARWPIEAARAYR